MTDTNLIDSQSLSVLLSELLDEEIEQQLLKLIATDDMDDDEILDILLDSNTERV